MKIYVGNLDGRITDAQLNDLASSFGKPSSANIARRVAGGASKGYGFVEYETEAAARAAIRGLDGKELHGQQLQVFDANALEPQPWSAADRRK